MGNFQIKVQPKKYDAIIVGSGTGGGIVKDKPKHQILMRGGLHWLDMQCLKQYKNSFEECSTQQQMEMVDEIAWPKKAKAEMKPGVAFFNLMRNLTATGFYTSEICLLYTSDAADE